MSKNTSFDRYRDEQLSDPEIRHAYQLARAQIELVDQLVRGIDERREELGMSKADLARAMGVEASAIRRLLTDVSPNPTVGTIAKAAHAVGLEISIRQKSRRRSSAGQV